MTDQEKTQRYQIDVEVDEQFARQVDPAVLVEAVAATLRRHDLVEAAVAVLVTDDAAMQALNRRYRAVDAPTDVLSFPQQADAELDSMPQDLPDELAQELRRHLGDLVIAFPYMARQAGRYHTSIPSELRLLAVHGVLHLLGYDHATDAEKAAMWAAQDAVLATLGERVHVDRDYD